MCGTSNRKYDYGTSPTSCSERKGDLVDSINKSYSPDSEVPHKHRFFYKVPANRKIRHVVVMRAPAPYSESTLHADEGGTPHYGIKETGEVITLLPIEKEGQGNFQSKYPRSEICVISVRVPTSGGYAGYQLDSLLKLCRTISLTGHGIRFHDYQEVCTDPDTVEYLPFNYRKAIAIGKLGGYNPSTITDTTGKVPGSQDVSIREVRNLSWPDSGTQLL